MDIGANQFSCVLEIDNLFKNNFFIQIFYTKARLLKLLPNLFKIKSP